MSKGKLIMIFLIFIIVGLFLWARYISTKGLIVREYPIENKLISNTLNGVKIVHFSDLHYGRTVNDKKLKEIVDKINLLKPDLVFFTGDLVDKDIKLNEKKLATIEENLKNISANIGKYAIKGNHDYSNKLFENIMSESGFKLLNNESELVYYKTNTPIILSGLPSSIKDHPDYENILTNLELKEEEIKNYYKILLVHEPDQILKLKNNEYNLVLAGHSHNGQVRLPFVGALIKTDGARKYDEEYYKVNDTDLYISGGIGCSVLNIRFMNKPSFNLYRLYNK